MAEYNPSKIVKDGNTYNFRDTTKIPLAGSNQISGSLIPSTNRTVNLGSPSYQWNNAYIKSLTINDKVIGTGGLTLQSKSGTARILLRDNSSSSFPNSVNLYSTKLDNNKEYGVFLNGNVFYPVIDNEMILGYAQRRWANVQTVLLNNLNPGALSLPNTTGLINIASSIASLDGVTINKFTPQVDGWLLINGTGVANEGFIYAVQGRIGMMSANNATMLRCAVLIPVVAGVEVSVTCKLGTLTWANIVPCQGNV